MSLFVLSVCMIHIDSSATLITAIIFEFKISSTVTISSIFRKTRIKYLGINALDLNKLPYEYI